jgi:hypothetical protein
VAAAAVRTQANANRAGFMAPRAVLYHSSFSAAKPFLQSAASSRRR